MQILALHRGISSVEHPLHDYFKRAIESLAASRFAFKTFDI